MGIIDNINKLFDHRIRLGIMSILVVNGLVLMLGRTQKFRTWKWSNLANRTSSPTSNFWAKLLMTIFVKTELYCLLYNKLHEQMQAQLSK